MRDLLTRTVVALAALALWAPGLAAQDWRTASVSRLLSGEDRLEAELRHVAGILRIRPAEGRTLFAMDLSYDADVVRPVDEFDGRRLTLGIESRGRDLRLRKDGRAAEMEVDLTTGVPLELALKFGAGRADLELGGLRLTDLEIETGASETELDVSRPNPEVLAEARFAVGAAQFTARRLGNLNAEHLLVEAGVGEVVLDLSGDWRRDLDLDVEMGLGALELRIPRGVGLRLTKDSFLTDLDAPEMDREGDTWTSANWDSAEHRIRVDVDAAFGSIDVVWIR